jgi:hypothetical protein
MIKKLVDQRSANYADRPKLYMQDIWEGSRIIMRGYDDLWKVERKLYHSFLNINVAKKYIPYQDLETKQLCVDLLGDPDHFAELITRTTTSLATSMSYGFRVTDLKSQVMEELFKNTHGFFTMVHSSKLLDWYPQLRPVIGLLPTWLYPMARRAKEVFYRERAQFHQLFDEARSRMRSNKSLPSKSGSCLVVESFLELTFSAGFAADIARSQESWKGSANGALLTDHAASYIAGIAMEGGADTTSNTLAAFIKVCLGAPDPDLSSRYTNWRVYVLTHMAVGHDALPRLPAPRTRGARHRGWERSTTINGAL